MRKRYSRSYTVLSFLTMFSYRELPLAAPRFWGSMPSPGAAGQVAAEGEAKEVKLSGGTHVFRGGDEAQDVF